MVAANEEAVPVSPHRMGTAGTVWAHMFPVVGDGLTCNAGTAHTLHCTTPLVLQPPCNKMLLPFVTVKQLNIFIHA